MRRTTIALLASLEAFVAALIGFGLAVVPLMLLWAVHFGMAVDVMAFMNAAGAVWLLGHGVNVTVQVDAVTAAQSGLAGAGDPFPISIALLGIALLTLAAGVRIGRRSAAGGHALTGALAAMAVFAAAGLGAGLLVDTPALHTNPWWAIGLPAFVVGLGALIGAVEESVRNPSPDVARAGFVRRAVQEIPPLVGEITAAAIRIGGAAVFGVLAVAATLVAVVIVLDYATIASLYQALDAGVVGGIALTMAELAVLPNLVIWAAAWMLGPGFAIGAGTSIAPGGILLGPVPGIPLLGALPGEAPLLGAVLLVVPVLLGFAGAWIVGSARRRAGAPTEWWRPLAVAVAAALVGGVALGLLARWSGGAIGPGRLAVVGPDGLDVALVAAITIGLGALAGGYAAFLGRADATEPGTTVARHDDGAWRADAASTDRYEPVPPPRAEPVVPSPPAEPAEPAEPVAPTPPAEPRRDDEDAPWWRRGRTDGTSGGARDEDRNATESFERTGPIDR
ncbi:cell division protein PerM [Agromyces sp. Marseille-Q5079]|uniref:cell division protein PerM n=1 Tax=Agromyces sp. Marseille-Q5079 TaxID=3439059 RepID=UPI003D9CACFA